MSEQPGERATLELGRYFRVVRRRWYVVVTGVALFACLAAAYALSQPKTATATVVVDLNVVSAEPFNSQRAGSELIDAATEIQLTRSSSVLAAVAEELGDETTPADVRRSTTAELVPKSTILRLTFTADTVDDAVAGADAFGDAVVDYRTELAEAKVDRMVEALRRRQAELKSEIRALNRQLARATAGSVRGSAAVADRLVLNTQLESLLSQLDTLAGLDTAGGYVATAATDNPVAVRPERRRLVEIGAALGLVLGLVAAFVIEATRRRVTSSDQVRRLAAGPVLASLPTRDGSIPADEADIDELRGAAERLVSRVPPTNAVALVADMTTHEPLGDVAANLALQMAEGGREVRLVLPEGANDVARILKRHSGRVVSQGGGGASGGQIMVLPARRPMSTESAATGAHVDPHWAGPTAISILALSSNPSRSELLRSARLSGAAVLVIERATTRVRDLRRIVADLESVGASVTGSIVVPKGRALRTALSPVTAPDAPASEVPRPARRIRDRGRR